MANYAKHVSKKNTPQTEKSDPREIKNNAGGFVFSTGPWAALDRFLILGAEGNTYYCSEKKMVKQNAANVEACIKEDGLRVVNRVVEISEGGRAPKNDPAIFVLALCAAADDQKTREAAFAALPKVCRIGTHLFHFAAAVKEMRGFGKGLRKAIAKWYTERSDNSLGMQLVKYQQRDGWSHRDLMRLSHPIAKTPVQEASFRYVVTGADGVGLEREVKRNKKTQVVRYDALDLANLPRVIEGKEKVKSEKDINAIVKLIGEYGLTHEMIPNEVKGRPEVWEALLDKMPPEATIRNLGKMSAVGLLKPLSNATKLVIDRLTDEQAIKKARLHPIAFLKALKVYEQGRGDKGKLTWAVLGPIVNALNSGFYLSFKTIEPTGKNILLAIDISGSMDGGCIAGVAGLTPRMGAAAMAMATMRVEKNWHIIGYTASYGKHGNYDLGVTPIDINPSMNLNAVCAAMRELPMGGTDCALPLIYAEKEKLDVDGFVSYTDNETWAGTTHVNQALKSYRKNKPDAKIVAVGMTATEYTVLDPRDPGSLNVCGFDTAAPAVISDFIRGQASQKIEEEA